MEEENSSRNLIYDPYLSLRGSNSHNKHFSQFIIQIYPKKTSRVYIYPIQNKRNKREARERSRAERCDRERASNGEKDWAGRSWLNPQEMGSTPVKGAVATSNLRTRDEQNRGYWEIVDNGARRVCLPPTSLSRSSRVTFIKVDASLSTGRPHPRYSHTTLRKKTQAGIQSMIASCHKEAPTLTTNSSLNSKSKSTLKETTMVYIYPLQNKRNKREARERSPVERCDRERASNGEKDQVGPSWIG